MKKYLKAIIACVFCTLVLSSCNASSPSNSNIVTESESLIKEITSSYLTEISTGTFATEIYKSNFTPNISFKDISFKQPQAQDLMNESMTRMTFKIQSVEKAENFFSDLFDKRIKANCFVEISAIDIEGMRAKINDPSLGYLELINLTKANDESLFIKKTIAIKLAYDDTLMKWEIMDNSQLMGLIMDPYRKMSLENPAGKPDTFATEYIQNFLVLDTKEIFAMAIPSTMENWEIENNMERARFFKDNNINMDIAKKLFQYIEIQAEPSQELTAVNPPDNYLEQAIVPVKISFPDITDDLRSLGHQANIDEIVRLLKKNEASNNLFTLEENLYLAVEKDTLTWHIDGDRFFYTIIQSIWNSIYVYPTMDQPDMLQPEEITNSCMNQLTAGLIDNVLLFQTDDSLSSLTKSSIFILDSQTRNRLFIQELLEGYNYTFISIEESKAAPNNYHARYSVSLPDLALLREKILADKETFLPLVKSLIEYKLIRQSDMGNQQELYNTYMDQVKKLMTASNLPLKEYKFELGLYKSNNNSEVHWVALDMSIVEPDQDISLIEFFGSDIANAAVESIIAEGTYSKEDFKEFTSYSF